MTDRLYIRHVCEVVAVLALLARHWIGWLRPEGTWQASFLAAIVVGVIVVLFHTIARNRAEQHDVNR
jgi:hypothetical protein